MFSSIRWRIASTFAAIIIVCIAGTGIFLSNQIRDRQIDELNGQLAARAHLVAGLSDTYFTGGRAQDLDNLAKRLGTQSGTNITFFDINGQVLGDSRQNPPGMLSQANMPEIIQAISEGQGSSIRQNSMYYAVSIISAGKAVGIVRVADSLTPVDDAVTNINRVIILGCLFSALLATLAAFVVSSRTMNPIKRLTQSVNRISNGEFDQEIPIPSRDEIGKLAVTLKLMASRLKETVKLISTERDRMSAILSRIGDAFFFVDSHSKITMINQAAEKIFQLPREKILNRTFIEAIHYYELDFTVQQCLKTMTQQTGFAEILPSRQFLGIVATPLPSEKSCLVLIQDLTRLKRLETVRRDFVANISHELRTPLSSIKALSETLQEGAIDDASVARSFVEKISVETDRLVQMVQELSELSRIESGKSVLDRKPINIYEIIQRSASRLKTQADRAGVSLELKRNMDLPEVLVDKDRIEQVLINLIHNAIKFTPSPGKIEISSRAEGNRVIVSVSDTGIGIPEDDLPRIFERFYKTDKARAGRGTGLGLSISKHTIQAHGGEIWVESRVGKGSIFSFSLPRWTF